MSFLTLLGKEMKMLCRNLVVYLLLAVIVLFYWTNFATEESWSEGKAPAPPVQLADQISAKGLDSADVAAGEHVENVPPMPLYGFKRMTDPALVAERYIWMLEADLDRGWMEQRIIFGAFAHKSKLSQEDREHMKETISRLERVLKEPAKHTTIEVQQIAADLDRLLGGWTTYMREGVSFIEPIETYEDAMKNYHALAAEYAERVADGQVYPGMARLFSDYMGLTAGLFPVFLAAFAMGRDRSSRINELVTSRSIRAWRYIGARYSAHVVLISLIYLLLAAGAAWQTAAALDGTTAFGEALPIFLAYTAGWLIPTVMATTAFGMLISVATGSGIAAIPLQLLWWFISVFPLIGDYRLYKLFLRFNTGADADTFHRYADTILVNRIFYVLLAVAMVAAAALIWEKRRSNGKITKSKASLRKRRATTLLQNGQER